MTRRPVSTPVRALAASSYLFPVAIVLLLVPAYRQIRLIRVHALVSLLLALCVVAIVGLLGHVTVFELSLFVGLLLVVAISGYFGLASWGALCAYQGRDPTVPGLTGLARRVEKRFFAAGPPTPVRRRKREPS